MNRRRQYEPIEIDDPSGTVKFGIRWTYKTLVVQGTSFPLGDETSRVWKSVALAVFLLLSGIAFFILSILHATGHFINKKDGAVRSVFCFLEINRVYIGMGISDIRNSNVFARFILIFDAITISFRLLSLSYCLLRVERLSWIFL